MKSFRGFVRLTDDPISARVGFATFEQMNPEPTISLWGQQ